MSDTNTEEPTVNTESEMEVEDKRAERKEEKEKNKKTCIFITVIVILAVISIGLLIALIIVVVKNNNNNSDSSSSPLEYTELYVSNEKQGKGNCESINNACDSLYKANKKINVEGDYKIYIISDTLNAEAEEIVIENSVTITKPSSSSLSNEESTISMNVCDINKEGDKKSLFSMSYKSRSLNICYISFLLDKNELKPSMPVISMNGGLLSLLSCSFGRVDEADDILTSSIIDITNGNCIINSCTFNNIQKEEGNGSAISGILNAGSSLDITQTILNGCILYKGNGGAIYTLSEYGSSVILKNVEFIGCESKEGDGGGMYSEVKDGAKMYMGENEGEDCLFKSCKAGSDERLMKGGGLYIKINNSNNIIINNVIFGKEEGELNEAFNGKGIFLEADEWNENTITLMFPIISKEGKDNRDILEGMKIKEGEEEGDIIDLYTAAYANDEPDSIFTIDIELYQIEETNIVKVMWTSDKDLDEIKIEVIRNDRIIHCYSSIEGTITNLLRTIEVEGIYGKQKIRVTARKGTYMEIYGKDIAIKAKKYIIAPLVATAPVTIFTCNLKKYTYDYTIPTIIWMERYAAYNWSSLPKNFFLLPNMDEDEFISKNVELGYQRTAEYVKELHEIDETSTFELYINDGHMQGALMIVYALNLKDLFYIHMLSDGAGSAYQMRVRYSNPTTADSNYEEGRIMWNKLKASVIKNGKYTEDIEDYVSLISIRQNLIVILGEESNIDYVILTPLSTIVPEAQIPWFDKFINCQPKKLKIETLAEYNAALTEEEKTEIKYIFHISPTLFEKAEELHKKVLCVLGQARNEQNLEYFIKYIKKTYGNEYVIYYKGHPANPTSKNNTKVQMFSVLEVTDIDASIPFEMIYFFNLNMMVSGYQSSTFDSLPSEVFLSLFDQRREDILADNSENLEYRKRFVNYMTYLNKNDEKYGSYARGNSPILIQFNDEEESIAVYNPDDDSVINYKPNSNGGYDVVN